VGIVHALPEESQLIAELASVFRNEMSCVIPPLCTEIIVCAMIAWKLMGIAADGFPKVPLVRFQ
jgi:hypothetical protein